jgi:hypothetical protein
MTFVIYYDDIPRVTGGPRATLRGHSRFTMEYRRSHEPADDNDEIRSAISAYLVRRFEFRRNKGAR